MTTIPSLSLTSPYAFWPEASPTTDSTPDTTTAVTPSTIVTLGATPDPAAATYTPAKTIWQSDNRDAVSGLMAENIQATSSRGRLKGLAANLLQRFGTDASDFSQMVSLTSTKGLSGSQLPDIRSTLQIKTTGGADVTLTLNSQKDSLAVGITTHAELSDKERAAIAGLAEGLQQAVDGLTAGSSKLDLSGLLQYDSQQLSSVDFQTEIKPENAPATQFVFHSDNESRSLSVDGPDGKVALKVDTRHAQQWGDQAQQAASIDSTLKQFDQAAARGQADDGLVKLLKDGFSQLNRNDQKPAGSGVLPSLNEQDHAMLTGLADFSASVDATPTQPNDKRSDEWKTFSYQLSQHTEIDDKNMAERHVIQTQQAHLSASFHTAVPGEGLNFKTQTYIYNQIDDSVQSRTEFAYHNAQLAQALVQQSASQSTLQQQYIRGQKVSDTTTPKQNARAVDLRPLVIDDAHEDATKTAAEREAQHAKHMRLAHALIQLPLSPSTLDAAQQTTENTV
ncbi:hypothetical protein [Paludibacterium purpuratum]|uniref:Lactate dehydrogenase n=1 Tax=Paludibacterium purpuratum TaxID=1144873 RepID=A0A4R7BAC1_9NEIS|nr:hypothetical protein [Paludibacterium purpuratum]TDR81523.1 hypothetical protein DFP86_103176 [Paludibacterium purpuratum]